MDHFDATKVEFVDKLQELKKLGEPPQWRLSEGNAREEWIAAVKGTITNYRTAAQTPGDAYGHIAAEKLALIVKECDTAEKWLADKMAEQKDLPKYKKPV